MLLAIHQPNYLPNLGFFYKMMQVDMFVLITNLQFEKNEGWQQRHKIPGPHGDIWLTVPVLGSQNQLIKEVNINNRIDWQRKHSKSIQRSYNKTVEKEFLVKLLNIYNHDWDRLVDINTAIIRLLTKTLDISTKVVLDEATSGEKQNILINVCKVHAADGYLSGIGAKDYFTDAHFEDFKKNNIEHRIIDKNITGQYPYSTIHYILSQGGERTRECLTA